MRAFADSVFFCNSGAEANEGMIKMMRRAMSDAGKPERFRFICFEGAFHGRTLATLAATGNAHYLEGFGPVVDGFDHVPFNNMNAVRNAIGPQTCGIIVEPIQGEGGVRPADMQFLRDLRAVCDEYGIILGMDEVQSGMGRTGKLFAHEWSGITPDVMSSAKGIGGGFPLGAVLAKEQFAKALVPGTHGTTYGGNPLACAAGNAVLDVVLAPGFLEDVERKGRKLRGELDKIAREFPSVFVDARGLGLLLGMKCAMPQGQVQAACVAEGLMAITAGDNVLRLAPPLVVTDSDLDQAVAMLRAAATKVAASVAGQGRGAMSGVVRRRVRDAQGQSSEQGTGPRHFLDLRDFDRRDVAADAGRRVGLQTGRGRDVAPPGRQDAGADLRKALHPDPRLVRGRHAPARRRRDHPVAAGTCQLGRGESVADTARVLSRYVDAIMLRTDKASKLQELAEYATVPVINGLTEASHPCQLMADVLTFEEHRGPIAGQVVAWCGDGNNVARSWIEAAVRFGFTLRLATPDGLRPPDELIELGASAGREDRVDRRSGGGSRGCAVRRDRYLGVDVG